MKHRLPIYLILLGLLAGMIVPRVAMAQFSPFKIPIVLTDSMYDATTQAFIRVRTQTIEFGLHQDATNCFDYPTMFGGFVTRWNFADTGSAQENDYPSDPPNGERFIFQLILSCQNYQIQYFNIQKYNTSAQADTFRFSYGLDNTATVTHGPTTFSWPSVLNEYFDSCVFVKVPGQPVLANMRTQSSLTVAALDPTITPNTFYTILYKGIRTPPGAPAVATPISPLDGATNVSWSPTLSWNVPTPAPDSYYLQVSRDSTFASSLLFNGSLLTTSHALSGLTSLTTYYWRVLVANKYGISINPATPYRFTTSFTASVDTRLENRSTPHSFGMYQNYPNPFNPTTTIRFDVQKSSFTDLSVYNILGQKVATLHAGRLSPGTYSTVWNGTSDHGNAMPGGVYLVRMSSDDGQGTQFTGFRKLLLMK